MTDERQDADRSIVSDSEFLLLKALQTIIESSKSTKSNTPFFSAGVDED